MKYCSTASSYSRLFIYTFQKEHDSSTPNTTKHNFQTYFSVVSHIKNVQDEYHPREILDLAHAKE